MRVRIDDIASLALGLNGPHSAQMSVFDALEVVTQALDGSDAYRALLGIKGAEDIKALEIVKARFVSLVGEEEWLSWWEGSPEEGEEGEAY